MTFFERHKKTALIARNPAGFRADNQKAALCATFGGLKLVQAPGLSTNISIANREILSRYAGENLGTVEVAGIEPASPWLISQGLSQSTPTAFVLYHDTTSDQNQ